MAENSFIVCSEAPGSEVRSDVRFIRLGGSVAVCSSALRTMYIVQQSAVPVEARKSALIS